MKNSATLRLPAVLTVTTVLAMLQCLLFASASSTASVSPPGFTAPAEPKSGLGLTKFPLPSKRDGYVDPVSGNSKPQNVLRPFVKTAHNWQRGHRGVDLDMRVGSTVLSAGTGTVSFAGSVAGRPSVSILHADGIKTTYTPVHGQVREGQHVKAGEPIGTLASATDGFPGLHWGALTAKDTYINPLSLLPTPMIRLKALAD